MKDPKQQSRKDFEKSIILKAWNDPEFKERLLADPKQVFQEELQSIDKNFKLPENMNVKVLEEDANTLYLVLPQDPQAALQKMKDEMVDSAAGGSILVAVVVSVAVAVNAQLAANANTAGNLNAVGNANVYANANATTNANTMS